MRMRLSDVNQLEEIKPCGCHSAYSMFKALGTYGGAVRSHDAIVYLSIITLDFRCNVSEIHVLFPAPRRLSFVRLARKRCHKGI